MSARGEHGWLISGSIQKSLLRALGITTGAALALAASMLVVAEIYGHRGTSESNLNALASVIALYSEAALEFGDRDAGREALAALQSVPRIDAAVLYDAQGNEFATFGHGAAGIDRDLAPGIRHNARSLEIVREIQLGGATAGHLWIRRDTADLVRGLGAKLAALGVAMIGALLLAFALANRLGRHIARPLEAQVEASAAVANGDLSVQVPESASGELGELARAFNTMTAGLRALVSQVGQGVAEVVAVSRTLEERGARLGLAASSQSAAIGEATESVQRVAESTRSVNQNVEELAANAEQTAGFAVEMDTSVAEIIARMSDLTEAISATSAAVSQVIASSSQITHNTDTLRQATNGTARHLEDLTRTVSAVASKATESSSLSQDSSRAAEEGMTAVRQTSSAMDAISTSFGALEQHVVRLSERSTSIGEIVQVITEIADETKLLALNASIIAAQAGDGGRAFSVVAREVGELAQRTHRSAGEITALIRSTQQDTSAAVAAVEEGSARIAEGVQRSAVSGRALERILSISTTSATRTREIAEATALQAQDLDRVGVAVRDIDDAVDSIHLSTREQERSSEEIARQIASIRDLGGAVQESTERQRRGSSQVSTAAKQMSETLTQIVGETSAQTRSGETIEQTLLVFSEVSGETVRSAEAITTAVATLQKRAEWLAEESRRFRTGSS
jgi:methyl-accepting chemotaxis protein